MRDKERDEEREERRGKTFLLHSVSSKTKRGAGQNSSLVFEDISSSLTSFNYLSQMYEQL